MATLIAGCVAAPLMVACGGGGNSGTPSTPPPVAPVPPTTYSIGGTVSGLAGSGLVLQLRDDEELPVNGNGAFRFTTTYPTEADYGVRVALSPGSPAQKCAVTNGRGTIQGANVSNVAIDCETVQPRLMLLRRADTTVYIVGIDLPRGIVRALDAFEWAPPSEATFFSRFLLDTERPSVAPRHLVHLSRTELIVDRIDAESGQITRVASFTHGVLDIRKVLLHPSENFIYVSALRWPSGTVGDGASQVALYGWRLDPATRTVSAVPGSPQVLADCGGAAGVSGTIHVHPSGRFLYATSVQGVSTPGAEITCVQRYRVDQVTGALTEEPAARGQFPGLVLQNQQTDFAPWKFIAPATYESWAISSTDGTLSRVIPQSGDCANPAERQRYVHPTRRQIWFDDATSAASLQVCRWQSQTGRWTRQTAVQRPAPIRSLNLDYAFDSCRAYPTGARCLGIYSFPLVAIPPLLITQPIEADSASGSLDVVPGAVGYRSGASGLGTSTTADATGQMVVDETFGSTRNVRIAKIDPASGSVGFLPGASFLELPIDVRSTVLAVLYGAEPPAM